MTPEPTSLSHCKNRESQVYQQSNIDIELGLQVGMNIGAGILHDVLSPGFAFKRSNPKLIDALKEIERFLRPGKSGDTGCGTTTNRA